MDKSKIKNFIILVLALVNIFLLLLLVMDLREASRIRQNSFADLLAVFSQNGIDLSGIKGLPEENDEGYILLRDMDRELFIASAAVGAARVSDQGGNIFHYTGPWGQGVFRQTGEFEIQLYGPFPESGGEAEAAGDILKKMELPARYVDQIFQEDGQVTLRYVCQIQEKTLYNCIISFVFSQGELLEIKGARPLDIKNETKTHNIINFPTIMMRFLDITKEGYVCSRVEALESGYIMTTLGSGEAELTPVWKIVTDGGDYHFNAVTGKLESPQV